MKTNRTKYTNFSMLLLFLKGSKRFFLTSILASAIVAGLDMVTPQVIRIVVDGCLSNETETLPGVIRYFLDRAGGREFIISHLYLAAVVIVATALLTAVFQYLTEYLNSQGTQRMVKTARDVLFAHIERLPFSWHMENQTGDIIQRCTSDVTMVQNFISEQLVQVIRIVVLILFSVIFMVTMSVRLSLVVFISVPIIVGYSYFFFRKIGHLFLECDENEGVLSTITQENLTGVRVVRAFGRENYERERFQKQNHIYTNAWMDLCKLLSGFWASGDMVMGLQLMLLVVIGAVLCVQGDMTAGILIAFISYNRRLIWPVRRLGRMISEMSKASVSMERLLYILNSEAEDMTEEGSTPEMTGDIVFDQVSFGYTESEKILKDISVTIKGGTTLGILGGTGSGKSTMMHLLNRLYDLEDGEITIDGIPVGEIPLPWLRSHIGMVLQEPYLFSRTIGENISIVKESTMEEIRHAARVACIDESIGRFAKGYETIVGERGVTLSGGQKQRTAIARMLVQDTPIMVFDDSLSAVDTETDEKIRHALKQYMGHATVIIISHRISTLMDADQIIVLDRGRIVQQGTHQELVQESGPYQEIYKIQSPEEEDESRDCTENGSGGFCENFGSAKSSGNPGWESGRVKWKQESDRAKSSGNPGWESGRVKWKQESDSAKSSGNPEQKSDDGKEEPKFSQSENDGNPRRESEHTEQKRKGETAE